MPSTYKLTLTKRDAPAADATENPVLADTVIYVHHVADEAAAQKIVHELTRPQRVRRGRPPSTEKSAK